MPVPENEQVRDSENGTKRIATETENASSEAQVPAEEYHSFDPPVEAAIPPQSMARSHSTGQQTSGLSSDTGPLIIITYNEMYLRTGPGVLRILQAVFTIACLITVTTAGGGSYSSYLLLPLSWHFRVMVFVLVITLLTTLTLLFINLTALTATFPLNWPLLDCVLYSVFAFLYLVGSSLIASAFDFYQKTSAHIANSSKQKLLISTVFGYVCMVLYASTAIHGLRQWRWLIRHQYRRRRLMEMTDDLEV